MKKRIGIIGHFGKEKKFFDGQTIKTREVNEYIEKFFDIKIDKFDTYKITHNPIKLIYNTIKILKNNDIVIVILYTRGYKIILPILMMFNKFYKRRIFDFVIGGKRYEIYKNNNHITRLSKKIEKIYVETNKIKEEYNKRNINNVDVISNFKILAPAKFRKTKKSKIKICIFSRILKEKGIEESIKSVIRANNEIGKEIFTLDIYGEIQENYKQEFDLIVDNSPKYIKYLGKVDYYKSVNVINNYDIMLFLTYYKNEGFPGTIIDSLYSGVPVIATEWNYNFEILKEDYTGIKVKIKDIDMTVGKLIYLYNNINVIDNMKKNCLKETKKYEPDTVMKKFIDLIK